MVQKSGVFQKYTAYKKLNIAPMGLWKSYSDRTTTKISFLWNLKPQRGRNFGSRNSHQIQPAPEGNVIKLRAGKGKRAMVLIVLRCRNLKTYHSPCRKQI